MALLTKEEAEAKYPGLKAHSGTITFSARRARTPPAAATPPSPEPAKPSGDSNKEPAASSEAYVQPATWPPHLLAHSGEMHPPLLPHQVGPRELGEKICRGIERSVREQQQGKPSAAKGAEQMRSATGSPRHSAEKHPQMLPHQHASKELGRKLVEGLKRALRLKQKGKSTPTE